MEDARQSPYETHHRVLLGGRKNNPIVNRVTSSRIVVRYIYHQVPNTRPKLKGVRQTLVVIYWIKRALSLETEMNI